MTLSDLRPNAEIDCIMCEQKKLSEGSRKFHKHVVCGECVKHLDALPDKAKS